jgi:hypothetical protein
MTKLNPEEYGRLLKVAISEGRKIEAIKLIRRQTGVGLAEAKYAAEKLEEEFRARTPEIFPNAKPTGCSTGLLLLLAAAVGIFVSWRS